ncbi:MAG: hypothetical protein Ct9H300mP20_02810 [Gammaproteobacteria bacterium]|nr:MAG: hypothetical protein Ct9H300mP20_02810 [Gammaproteobacteria bacterium]
MFIAMDEPKHGVQRKAVQSAVAPQQISELGNPFSGKELANS